MSEAVGTIEQLAGELARILQPLVQRVEQDTVHVLPQWLGLRPCPALVELRDLAAKLDAAAGAALECLELARTLAAAIVRDDEHAIVVTSAAVLNSLDTLVQALRDAATALGAAAENPRLTPQQQVEIRAFASSFVERLLQRLLVEYIQTRFPHLAQWLTVTGVIEVVREEGGPDESLNGPYDRKSFYMERVPRLLSNPIAYFQGIYKWGHPEFDGLALFAMLQSLLNEHCQISAKILQPRGAPTILEAFGFSAEVNQTLTPPGLDVSLRMPACINEAHAIEEQDWQANLTTQIMIDADSEFSIRPFSEITVHLPEKSAADVHFTAEFSRSLNAVPFLLLGTRDGSRVEIQRPSARVRVDVHAESHANRAIFDPEVEFKIHGGRLVLDLSQADGFLTGIFRHNRFTIPFDLAGEWSLARGLRISGGVGLAATVPLNIVLNGLRIDTLHLALMVNPETGRKDNYIGAVSALTMTAQLGPVSVLVEQCGLQAILRFPESGGNLGVANLDLEFKPPTGVGLALNTTVATAAGYLYFDSEKREYAGILHINLGTLSVTAVGLLTTRMPDGSPIPGLGYSLFAVIAAQFPPIQLGFGFTLNGIGGILGVNRTSALAALRAAVPSHALDTMLFPADPLSNAPAVISSLNAIFPVAVNRFLLGPMVRLAWGTPPLLTFDVAVLIELPAPVLVVLLGRIKLALPRDSDAAPVVVHMDVLGTVDFEAGLVEIDADLYDSVIAGFPITGKMALRARWKSDPTLTLAIGGFHPAYHPPSDSLL